MRVETKAMQKFIPFHINRTRSIETQPRYSCLKVACLKIIYMRVVCFVCSNVMESEEKREERYITGYRVRHVVIPIIPIFMINLNRKSNWLKNWQKEINLLIDRWSIFYLRSIIDFLLNCNHQFCIKLWSSLIDHIYFLTMKLVFFHCQKTNRKIDYRKIKRLIIYDRKSLIGSKNHFLKNGIDFWSESLASRMSVADKITEMGVVYGDWCLSKATICRLHKAFGKRWNSLELILHIGQLRMVGTEINGNTVAALIADDPHISSRQL